MWCKIPCTPVQIYTQGYNCIQDIDITMSHLFICICIIYIWLCFHLHAVLSQKTCKNNIHNLHTGKQVSGIILSKTANAWLMIQIAVLWYMSLSVTTSLSWLGICKWQYLRINNNVYEWIHEFLQYINADKKCNNTYF